MIRQAERFARNAHDGQYRRGAQRLPYAVHLEEVADFVARHHGDEIAVAAAWLHDTVEDAGVTFDEIERRFGPQVAAIVRELTDDMSLPKAARKRHQLLGAPSRSHRAALIKIADKTSNVRSITLCPPDWCASRKAAYVDWARQVVHALPSVERDARDEFEVALDLYRTHAEPGEARGGLYAL